MNSHTPKSYEELDARLAQARKEMEQQEQQAKKKACKALNYDPSKPLTREQEMRVAEYLEIQSCLSRGTEKDKEAALAAWDEALKTGKRIIVGYLPCEGVYTEEEAKNVRYERRYYIDLY